MLYAQTIDPAPVRDDLYSVEPGSLLVFTMDVAEGARVTIDAVHAAAVQDFSLRVWVSKEPQGTTVDYFPQRFSYWHPIRTPYPMVVADRSLGLSEAEAISVEPGRYYVNVLNMINARNGMRFSLTES